MIDDFQLPRLQGMCGFIDDIIAGEAAESLADSGTVLSVGTLVVLPSWAWRVPKIDVGRKAKSSDGRQRLMPARIVWEGGPVRELPIGEELEIRWTVTGLGHNETGVSTVRTIADSGVQLVPHPGAEIPPQMRGFVSPNQLARFLRALVKTGIEARWALMTSLETFTKNKLAAANTAVAAELGGHHKHVIPSVLDEISLDSLLTQMLYGTGGSSVISRMVERSMTPTTFDRVDPMHWFAVNIRARAEEAVRQRIGDPKVGPKVRRIMEISQAATMDELLDAYRAVYPKDSLAKKRAIAALSAGPDLAVHQRIFSDELTNHTEDAA
jgi:hypothetical protein